MFEFFYWNLEKYYLIYCYRDTRQTPSTIDRTLAITKLLKYQVKLYRSTLYSLQSTTQWRTTTGKLLKHTHLHKYSTQSTLSAHNNTSYVYSIL